MALNFSDPQDAMRIERDGESYKVFAKQSDKDEVHVGTFRGQGDLVLHDVSGANNPGFQLTAEGRVVAIIG